MKKRLQTISKFVSTKLRLVTLAVLLSFAGIMQSGTATAADFLVMGWSQYSASNQLVVTGTSGSATISSLWSGWYMGTGSHSNGNSNYICGYYSGQYYRNFFSFTIPSNLGTITSAVLKVVQCGGIPASGYVTISFYDVTTGYSELTNGTSVSTFDDLGSGAFYGNGLIDNSLPQSNIVSLPLNAAARGGIQNAAGGTFVIGGRADNISTILPPDATTNSATNVAGSSATFNGSVNANGTATTVSFNYGTTSGSLTSNVAASPSSVTGSSATSVTAAVTGLTAGATYYYQVKAVAGSSTVYGLEKSFTTTNVSPPAAPTSISPATITICNGSGTTLTANGADGTVYWYADGSCGGTSIGQGNTLTVYPTATTTYTAKNYKNSLYSACSSSATVTVNNPATTPPSVAITATTATTANLSWGTSTATLGITYHWVVGTSVSTVEGTVGTAGVVAQGTTTAPTTSAIATTGLAANSNYYLRVYATTATPCGNSGYQTSGMFTTNPDAPVAGAATLVRANSFTANWAVSAGATNYFLDVSTDVNFGTGTFLTGYNNKSMGNVLLANLSGLNRATTYYYRVKAYNAGGNSVYSSTITQLTLPLHNFLIEKVGGGDVPEQLAGMPFSVKITARDAENTTVTDYTGTATMSTSNSTLTAGTTTTNFIAGILTSHMVTLTGAGTLKTLTATSGSVVSNSNAFTVTPASISNFELAVNGTVKAGTPFTVTATVYDIYHNVKTNYDGVNSLLWTTTATSAPDGTPRVIPENGNQTFDHGVATIGGFTFYNSDQSQLTPFVKPTITVTDAPSSKPGTTEPITVHNEILNNFKVVAGVVQESGVTFDATVTARDIYLNTCVDYANSIRFKSSNDALVTFPAGLQAFSASENKGVRTFTNGIKINTMGAYWLRVADASFAFKSGEQQNIVVGPGPFNKSAFITANSITTTVSTVTISDPATPNNFVDPMTRIAGEYVLVTITPRDAQGNLLYACRDISVLLNGSVYDYDNHSPNPIPVVNRGDGSYTAEVRVTLTGENLIRARYDNSNPDVVFDETRKVNVSPAPADLAHTTITPTVGTITTNEHTTITVQLKDAFDNNRSTNDGVVTLTTNLGGFANNLGTKTVVPTYSGSETGSYTTSQYAFTDGTNGTGTATISGSINFTDSNPDGAITHTASVAITEGLPDLTTSTVLADPGTITTNGTSAITVQLKDFLGNLVTHERGTVTLAVSPNGAVTTPTFSAGAYHSTLSGNFPGSGATTITGRLDGSLITDDAQVTFNQGLPDLAHIQITALPTTMTSDESSVITVQLKDIFGNLLTTSRGTITLSTTIGTLTGVTNHADGTYTATLTGDNRGFGNATVTGSFTGAADASAVVGAITDNAIVSITEGLPVLSQITITAGSTSITADGTSSITVQLKDQWGNNITHTRGTITLTNSLTGGHLTAVTDNNNGTYSATLSLTAYGTGEASITGNFAGAETALAVNGAVTHSATITVSPGAATKLTVLTQTSNTAIAGVVFGTQPQIRVEDQWGNLRNSDNATVITAARSTGTATLQGTLTATASGGIATFSTLKYNKAETITIGFSSSPVLTATTSGNVVVSSNDATHLAVTGTGTQVAGAAQNIRVTAYDAYDNVATGYPSSQSLTFSGAGASSSPVTNPTIAGVNFGTGTSETFTSGVADNLSMILFKAESAVVTVGDGSLSSTGHTLSVTVSPAAASKLVMDRQPATTAVAGVAFTTQPKVRIEDQYGNLRSADNSTVITAGRSTGTSTLHGTLTATASGGVATFSNLSYNKAETINLEFTSSPSYTATTSGNILVSPNTATYLAITGTDTQIAGTSQEIAVKAYDFYDNLATGYDGSKSLTFSGADGSPSPSTLPKVAGTNFATSTSLTFASGVASGTMYLYKDQTAEVTATDGSIHSDLHKLTVVVSPATPNYFAVTGTATKVAGVTQTIIVTAYDAFNNVATGYIGDQALVFTGAAPSPAYSPDVAVNPTVKATAFGSSTSLNFSSGVATGSMILYKAETALVNVSQGAVNANSHKLSVTVSAASAGYLAITGSATQKAGTPQNITISAFDPYNNPAISYAGSHSLTFSGADVATTTPASTHPVVAGTAFGVETALTFNAVGVATATMNLFKTQTALVTATDGSINSDNHKLSVLVGPALLKNFIVSGVGNYLSSTTTTHDLGTWQSVTVEPRDTYNNRKTDYVGSITFSNTDIYATNPIDYNFLLADAGIHIFSNVSGSGTNKGVKFSAVGLDWWLTAIDLAEPTKYGAQSGIIVQRAVTITANNITNKIYGNVETLGAQSISTCTVTGIVSGVNPVAGDITGITLASEGAAATAKVTAPGPTYPIIPTFATGPYNAALYRIVYSNGNLTVNKRDLTLTTFLADNKTYDGTTTVPNPRFTNTAVNGDGLTYNYNVAFDDKNFGTGKTVNFTGISISGELSGNYTLLTTSDHAHADIAKRDINVTAQTDTKTYDGSTTSSVLPVVDALQTPLVDLVTNPGIQTYDTESVGTSNKVLTPSETVINDGNRGANYAVHYVTNTTGTISTRPITITVTAGQTKVYGAANPSSYTYSITSGSLATDDAFSGVLSRAAGENANTYAIGKNTLTIVESSTNKEANYVVTFVGADFTITQKPLTVTAVTNSKTYDSFLTSANTPTFGAIASSDHIGTSPAQTYDNENVGSTHVLTPAGLVILNGSDANMNSNYNISYTTVSTGVITQKALSVTDPSIASKDYNASTTAGAVTVGTLSGFVTGETVTANGVAAAYGSANVGTYTNNVVTYTLNDVTGANAGLAANYSLATGLADGVITRKALSVTDPSIASKVYNATTTAGAVTVGTLSGFVTGETVTATGVAANYSSGNVGTYNGVVLTYTLYDVTGSGLAANYSLASGTGTGVIIQKALSVTDPSIATRDYNATKTAGSVTVGTISGFVTGETVTATGVSAAYSSANVNTYTGNVVTYTLHDVTGVNAGLAANYSLATGTATGIITQKALSVTAPGIDARDYNATTTAGAVSVGSLSGFIGTETVTATGVAANYSSKNVASYPDVVVTYTLHNGTNSGLAANYSLATGTATGVVNQLHFDVTAVYASKTYDGGMTSNGAPTFGAFPTGDVVNVAPTQVYDNKNVGTTHVMTASGLTIKDGLNANMTANYDIHYNTVATGVVIKLDITGTFTVTTTKVYDNNRTANITLQSLVGVLSGDLGKIKLTGGTATYSDKNVANGKTVTSAGMSLAADTGGDETGNYNLTGVATTTANITPRDLLLFTFAANSKTYNGNKVATGMGWQDDRLGTDELSFQWTAEFNSKDVGVAGLSESLRHVDYTNIVIFEGADKDNYNLVTTSGVANANITARSLTLSASGVNREYNGNDIATITFIDNKVSGDVFTVNYSATFNNKNVGDGKSVNVTGISLSGTDALNYSVAATATTTANITAKTITISPVAGQSKLVNDPDPTFTFTNSPALYSGDIFTGALGRNPGSITPNVGNYSYTLGNLSATNYTLVMTASPATFAIIRNTQNISLIAGWNIISSGVIPVGSAADMLTVFNPLGNNLKKAMDESGKFVEDWTAYSLGWQNTIGNILSTEGYKVKVNSNCTLTVSGASVSLPLSIPLTNGWNLISYPASANENAKSIVQALIDAGKLMKVMDERGAAIEDWTAYGFGWQNNIGDFAPGKGYLVKVNGDCNLTISEVLNKAATITPEIIASNHFKTAYTGNGVDHMSINLMDLQKSGIRQGDEIGIFDGTVCVGAATIGADQMYSGTISIPVSANDGLSLTVNGYAAGNPVSIKLYSNGVEALLSTEILNNVPAVFKKGESLFLKVSANVATGINSLSQTMDVKFYPNPFTDVLSIEINSSGEKPIDVMIYDVLGRKIRSLYTGSIQGSQIIKWDGTSDGGSVVRPGIYYLRCNGLTFNGIIKR